MTSYNGGKQKVGKRFADVLFTSAIIMAEERNIKIKGYCEPMCGMLGVYQYVHELFSLYDPDMKFKAGDVNESVILMWKALQKGWKPSRSISEKRYEKLKKSKDRSSAEKGYFGHQYSFGGKYFKGFSGKYGKVFNSKNVIDKISNIAKSMKDVEFSSGDYKQFSGLKNYIIYCDPPYYNTESHYKEKNFNHDEFHRWVKEMSKNNLVFVSEYTAPKDFTKLISISNKLTGVSPSQIKKSKKHKSKPRTENLFFV